MRTYEKGHTPSRQLVVLAGGSGNRLSSAGVNIPKVLLPVGESTILEEIIHEAELEGFSEVLLCLGNGAEDIRDFCQRIQSKVTLKFSVEASALGTFGALLNAYEMLSDEFVLIMGDLILAGTNLGGFLNFSSFVNTDIAILVKFTDHPDDSDLVQLDSFNKVLKVLKYPHHSLPEDSIGMAGGFYLKKNVLEGQSLSGNLDFTRDFLIDAVTKHHSIAYFHQGLIRDLGTIRRLQAMNSESRGEMRLDSRSAIFLDRDGTLNKHNGYIVSKDEIELTPWALKLMNQVRTEFDLLGLITNQPVISRGDLDYAGMWDLNNHLETLLNLKLDFIEFCPHHPDSGFLGEIVELKIRCSCRKPNPGMILKTLNEFKVRAENAVMVGDSISDLVAAERAGLKWIHLIDAPNEQFCSHNQLQNGYCLNVRDYLADERVLIL
jgi:D,D-heptose 1,7-bisphosphate phosphatase